MLIYVSIPKWINGRFPNILCLRWKYRLFTSNKSRIINSFTSVNKKSNLSTYVSSQNMSPTLKKKVEKYINKISYKTSASQESVFLEAFENVRGGFPLIQISYSYAYLQIHFKNKCPNTENRRYWLNTKFHVSNLWKILFLSYISLFWIDT